MRGASKETYAAYTLVYAAVLLFQNVQNALIISPMMTVVPGRSAQERAALVRRISRIQIALNVTLLAFWLGAAATYAVLKAMNLREGFTLAAAGAVALLGLLMREFGRGQAFLDGRPLAALFQDLAFGVFALAALAFLFFRAEVTAEAVLLSSGVSAFSVAALARLRTDRRYRDASAGTINIAEYAVVVRELWTCGKWALPSVVASWGYANAYVYMVAAVASASIVAELSATRLLLAPVPLLLTAWFNVFRPRASAWYRSGDLRLLTRVAMYSAVGLALGGVSFGVVLYLCFDWIEAHLLGSRYAGLAMLLLGWTAYFVVGAVRGVGMGCVLSAQDGFRHMHHYTWIALAVAVLSVALAAAKSSALGVLLALSVAELVFAGLVWGLGWPAVRRARSGGKPLPVPPTG